MIPDIANAHPCKTAYTMYNGNAQNMNINSNGSVTPVKNTANTVEINMERYLSFLSTSTRRYIASATPSNNPVAPII